MRHASRLAALILAAVLAAPAFGMNLGTAAQNSDLSYQLAYRAGNKPAAGTCPPSGWTGTNLGDGGGQVCDVAGDWTFNVFGTTMRQNARMVSKDAGAADVEWTATIKNDYAGSSSANAGGGIGLREANTQASWLFQMHVLQSATSIVECSFGANGTYTTTSGAVGQARPVVLSVDYDVSTGDVKGFADGDEVCSTNRPMSDVIAYAVGQSKSASTTFQFTLDDPTLGTTITNYTPGGGGGGGAPTLVTPIPNQTGNQGVAFTFDWRSYFSGATSYELGSAMPGALTESSDGILSGTPNATDVSSSPYSRDLCGRNASGLTCDSVLFTFTSPSGDVFTVPDVADVLSTFNCGTTGGANGASWASVRTSGSGTTVGPGDVIEITSGSRGATKFNNCNGAPGAPITIRKTASATQLTITGTGGGNDAFPCEDCTYVLIDGTVNYTGHTGECGPDTSKSETPSTDCGIKVDATNQFGLKCRGKCQFITWQGIEVDGNWPAASDFSDCTVATLAGCSAAQLATNNGMDVALSPNDQNYCVSTAPSLFNREFKEGLVARKLYVHHLAHEAIYFGPNVDYGNCTGATDTPRLKDITLEWIFVQFAGWDGVNCKSAIGGWGCNIDDLVVLDIGRGTEASGANSVGISLFESKGSIRRSKVRRTTDPPGGAAGLNCSANKAPSSWEGTDGFFCNMENNDVADTDGDCAHVGEGGQTTAAREANIKFNTFVDCGGQDIDVGQASGGGSASNNLVEGGSISLPGGFGNTNNRTVSENGATFTDDDSDGNVNDNNYLPKAGTAPLDNGQDGVCPSTDILGTVRPQGAHCDQGAYERTVP